MQPHPLTPEPLNRMDGHWRAANYLSVGQIYLYDNPLLREPLLLSHVKPKLLAGLKGTPLIFKLYEWVTVAVSKSVVRSVEIAKDEGFELI